MSNNQDVYESLSQGNQNEELYYRVHNIFLYQLGKLCIPRGERNNIIRDTHTLLITGHLLSARQYRISKGIVIGHE